MQNAAARIVSLMKILFVGFKIGRKIFEIKVSATKTSTEIIYLCMTSKIIDHFHRSHFWVIVVLAL